MPAGFGYRPSAGGIDTQLSTLTRRAELARVVVQIWNSSPTIAALLANAQLEAGGMDSVVANVQYAQLVQPQWTSFQGNFSAPSVVQGVQPATWTFCWAVCPIPVMISELLIQDEQAIQSIVNLRMTDAGNAMRDMIAFSLYNNTTNNLQIIGLPGAVDNGGTLATYGGINRTANPWWQSKVYSNSSAALTRQLLSQYILGVVNQQGEAPDFIVMHPSSWGSLYADILATGNAGSERYWPNQDKTDKYLSSFRAIEVAGVPVYMDPYVPATPGVANGIAYLLNTNYVTMKVHQQAQWEFMDFVPMTPVFQLSYTGVAYIVLALVNTKPLASAKITTINNISI